MRIAPLRGGVAKERDVEQVGFAGVDGSRLRLGDGGRDEGFLDGVGVDAVIDLRERALEVPAELEAVVFVVLEALELLDEVDFEFDRDPRSEFEGNVFVGVGAPIAAGFGNQTNGPRRINLALGGENETIESCLFFNPIEFDGIKTGVVELLPDAEKLNGIAIAEPVRDEVVRSFGIFVTGDVGEGNKILLILGKHSDDCALDCDAVGFRFAHGLGQLLIAANSP